MEGMKIIVCDRFSGQNGTDGEYSKTYAQKEGSVVFEDRDEFL